VTTITPSTFRSFVWSSSDVALRQGIQLIVSILLARLLSPAEFGTVALLYFFNGLSLVFIEGGLSSALIQRVSTSRDEESSVFWLNLAIGALCASILAAFARSIAQWFGQPILVPLTLVSALTTFIGSTATIQTTLLSRQLDFKTQAKAGFFSNSLAGITAVFLAYRGAGVWALSLQALAAATLNSVTLWTLSSWRPVARFNARAIASLWRFGVFMLGAGILESAYTRIYSILIGRWSGTVALGFYNRADSVMQFPMASLTATFSRVVFPILSAAKDNPGRMHSGLRMALQTVAAINAPLMLGLAATAKPTIALLLGPQWQSSVPILRVLCIAGAFWPLQVMNYQAIIALGHSRLMFTVEASKRIAGLFSLILVAPLGLLAIASVGIVYNLIGFTINAHYAGRFIGYSSSEQIRDLAPTYLVAASMAVCITILARAIHYPPLVTVPLLTTTGGLLYLALGFAARLKAFTAAKASIMTHRKSMNPDDAKSQ
jgi:teichuronic acid exporter